MIRIAAAIVAVIAWGGLVIQFGASSEKAGSALGGILSMLRFFTVLTNLGLAILFTAIAAGRGWALRPRLFAGLLLAILLVGIVYGLLLRGLETLTGGAAVANVLLHNVTPILVPLFWLAFVPKGRLRWADTWRSTLFPLGYFVYALAIGAASGRYPYPFMNVAQIGWGATLLNAALMATGFVIVGLAVVALDRRLATSRPPSSSHPSGSRDI